MQATLVVAGEITQVAVAARVLGEHFPHGLEVHVEQPPIENWTPEAARTFVARLAPAARTALIAVLEGGGFAADDVLRNLVGDSLRGAITGPMTVHIGTLIKQGVLPEGTTRPLVADYLEGVTSFQRTSGLRMSPDLIPVFADTLDVRLHENLDLDREITDAVLTVLRRHIPDFATATATATAAGIEHLVVAVRSDDEDAAERNFCVFTGSRQEAATLLRTVTRIVGE